ncbi:flagellar hook-length control protein FliK [Cryobacterium sp. MP_3.1]|uniref:flagellar hook-length control protein FliK n=1 Tax=Cryobacterium sp. MP_3.1 TaxID=3071711 RepID=UPI002DFF9C7E|nr:flagellar hook-length control protein FliK [Cryobacterium sp. MP_3.1]
MAQPTAQPTAQALGRPVGTAATEHPSPAPTVSTDTGSAAIGTAVNETVANGTVAYGTATNGTALTATTVTGFAATGTAATGTAATATAVTATAATTTAATGTAATTSAATGTAVTETAATETAATETAATGTAATATAPGVAATVVWSTRTPGAVTDESAAAENPTAGLVPPAAAGQITAVAPVTGSPAGAPSLSPSTGAGVPVPLASQVARPLFTLAAAGPGEHTMSISVTPDDLGPVLVRAQISATGIRLELFASTDVARDALRLILPDLRRDLAGGALTASLDVSARNQPGDADPSGRQDRNADQPGQGNPALGGDQHGAHDRRRDSGAADPWLRSPPIGADTTDAAADPTRSDLARGRVDVLA